MSQESIKQQLTNLLEEAGYTITVEELAELDDKEVEAIFGGWTEPPVWGQPPQPQPMYGIITPPPIFREPSCQELLAQWRKENQRQMWQIGSTTNQPTK